jgi:DNA replication and repair protein RecF
MLKNIKIRNFRNLINYETDLKPGITTLYGRNGSGKSSLIEAIYFLSIGSSFRARHDRDTVNKNIYGSGDFAHIKGIISNKNDFTELQLMLNLNDSMRLTKNSNINGAKIKLSKFVGVLKSVCFSVNDIDVILGSPSDRRKYIDLLNMQLTSNYASELLVYKNIVESRNALLKNINKNYSNKEELEYWNTKMIDVGSYIIQQRYKSIQKLAESSELIFSKIFNAEHTGKIEYVQSIDTHNEYHLSDDFEEIRSHFSNKIIESEAKDISYGRSTIGPHRDDLLIKIDGDNAYSFASRGQARLLILGMKLAECELIKQNNVEPIILLDDAFSELDFQNQEYLTKFIADYKQCLITGLDFRVIKNLNMPTNELLLGDDS